MGTTALILVDVLKAFFDPRGSSYYLEASDVLPSIRVCLDAGRESDVLVVHAVESHNADVIDDEQKQIPVHCVTGSLDCEYALGFEPKLSSREVVVTKTRYSAFFSTELDLVLRSNAITQVVLVGVKANVCVRATAQDAFGLGYKVIVPEGATNSNRPHLAVASLEDIDRYMGSVRPLSEVLQILKRDKATA
jgi:maleamate amidohydrolase